MKYKIKIPLTLIIYLLSSIIVIGQSFDQLEVDLEECIKQNEIPGAAVVVANSDSVLYKGCFGYAHLEKEIPVTDKTHFWVGSISKSFTALGILKLVESGRIDLNVEVKEVLPDIDIKNPWSDTDPVRLVHLLEHTAGLCDGVSTSFNWHHDPNIPLEEVIHLHKRINIYNRPGSYYLYSNTGYLLIGLIIEKTTDMKYEEFLRNEILNPLGMNTTTFNPKDPYNLSTMAQGYGKRNKEIPLVYAYQRSAAHTYSSISEMANYLIFYLNHGSYNGAQILKPEYINRMETPKTSMASRIGLHNAYGLGNEWAFRNQHKWRGHNGAGWGFYSDLWYNRDRDIGYVVLINQFDPYTGDKVRKLRELIAEHLTRNIKPEFQPVITFSEEDLKEYCGTYTIGYGAKDPLGLINYYHGITKVELADSAILIKQVFGNSDVKIYPVSKGLFRDMETPEPTVAFFATPEGNKAMVYGRDYFRELSPWKFWLAFFLLIISIVLMLSTIVYGLIWISVSGYKRIYKNQAPEKKDFVVILPFLATIILITGFILIFNQEIYYLGKKTFANVGFFISTLLFLILSLINLIYTIRFLTRFVNKIQKVYHLIVSVTLSCLSIYLWYWGIIGLKLWI